VLLNLLKISDKPLDKPPDKRSDKPSSTKKKPWRCIAPNDDEPQSRKHNGTWFYWCKSCNLWSKTHDTSQHGNNKQNFQSDTDKSVNLVLDPSIWKISPPAISTIQTLTVGTPNHDAFPIIWDSGVSVNVTNTKSDFIAFSPSTDIPFLGGYATGQEDNVQGVGTVA